jgi:hypothetical protein
MCTLELSPMRLRSVGPLSSDMQKMGQVRCLHRLHLSAATTAR